MLNDDPDDLATRLSYAFMDRYGTWPTTGQILLMLEAQSSTRLDGETFSFDAQKEK